MVWDDDYQDFIPLDIKYPNTHPQPDFKAYQSVYERQASDLYTAETALAAREAGGVVDNELNASSNTHDNSGIVQPISELTSRIPPHLIRAGLTHNKMSNTYSKYGVSEGHNYEGYESDTADADADDGVGQLSDLSPLETFKWTDGISALLSDIHSSTATSATNTSNSTYGIHHLFQSHTATNTAATTAVHPLPAPTPVTVKADIIKRSSNSTRSSGGDALIKESSAKPPINRLQDFSQPPSYPSHSLHHPTTATTTATAAASSIRANGMHNKHGVYNDTYTQEYTDSKGDEADDGNHAGPNLNNNKGHNSEGSDSDSSSDIADEPETNFLGI